MGPNPLRRKEQEEPKRCCAPDCPWPVLGLVNPATPEYLDGKETGAEGHANVPGVGPVHFGCYARALRERGATLFRV